MITLSPRAAARLLILMLAFGATACLSTKHDPELQREIDYIENMSPG